MPFYWMKLGDFFHLTQGAKKLDKETELHL